MNDISINDNIKEIPFEIDSVGSNNHNNDKKTSKLAFISVFLTAVFMGVILFIYYLIYHKNNQLSVTTAPVSDEMNLGNYGFELKNSKKFVSDEYNTYPTYDKINLTSYKLHLNIESLEDEWVDAQSTLSFNAQDYDTHYNFDLSENTIKVNSVEVYIDGNNIDSSADFYNTDKLTVTFKGEKIKRKVPNSLKIQIKFFFKINILNKLAKGFYRVKTNNNDIVLQTNLSYGNVKYVFPSFDLYRTNFSFVFSATIPEENTMFSNGRNIKEIKKDDKKHIWFSKVLETRFSNYGWVVGKFDNYHSDSSSENIKLISREQIPESKVEKLYTEIINVAGYISLKNTCSEINIIFVPTLEDHQDISRCLFTIDEKYLKLDDNPTYSLDKVKLRKHYIKGIMKQIFGGKLTPLNETEVWAIEALRKTVENYLFNIYQSSLFGNNPTQNALESSTYTNSARLGSVFNTSNDKKYKELKLKDDLIIQNQKERINKGIFLFNMVVKQMSVRHFIRFVNYLIENSSAYFTYKEFQSLKLEYENDIDSNSKFRAALEDIVYKNGIPMVRVERNSLDGVNFNFTLRQFRYYLTENDELYTIYNLSNKKSKLRKEINILFDDNGNKVDPVEERYIAPLSIDGFSNSYITERALLLMNYEPLLNTKIELKKESNEYSYKNKNINYLGYNLTNNYFILTPFYEIDKDKFDYLFGGENNEYLKNYLFKMHVWLRGNLVKVQHVLGIKNNLFEEYKKRNKTSQTSLKNSTLTVLVDFGVYLNKLVLSNLQRTINNSSDESKQKLVDKMNNYKTEFTKEFLEYNHLLNKQISDEYSLNSIPNIYKENIIYLLKEALIYVGETNTIKKYSNLYDDESYTENEAILVFKSKIKSVSNSETNEQEKLLNELYELLKRSDKSLTVKKGILKSLGAFEDIEVIDSIIEFIIDHTNNLYGKYRVLVLKGIIKNGLFTEYTLNKLIKQRKEFFTVLDSYELENEFYRLFGYSGDKNIGHECFEVYKKTEKNQYAIYRSVEEIEVNIKNDKYNNDI